MPTVWLGSSVGILSHGMLEVLGSSRPGNAQEPPHPALDMSNDNKKDNFMNISLKFQLHPHYGFWGDDFLFFFPQI